MLRVPKRNIFVGDYFHNPILAGMAGNAMVLDLPIFKNLANLFSAWWEMRNIASLHPEITCFNHSSAYASTNTIPN